MENGYTRGQKVKLRWEIRDENGVLVDADAVEISLKLSATLTSTFTLAEGAVQRIAAGIYQYVFDSTNYSGIIRFRWYASGAAQHADEGQIFINKSNILSPL